MLGKATKYLIFFLKMPAISILTVEPSLSGPRSINPPSILPILGQSGQLYHSVGCSNYLLSTPEESVVVELNSKSF